MKATKKKDDDVDVSTLPPWLSLSVSLNFGTSKERAAKILKSLQHSSYEPKKFITREEIINFGKEKQMYVDPTQVNEKQKKAPTGGDVPTELTPELLSKIFVQFYTELNVQGRKAKKEYQEAIAAGKDPNPKKDSKDANKAAKKDPKSKKVEEVIEEKPEEPPMDKHIDKLSDFVYFLTDYPSTKEEFVELSKAGGTIDMILRINEQVIPRHSEDANDLLQNGEENFEEVLKRKMEEFIDGEGAAKFEQQKKAASLSEEDKAFIRANNKIVLAMKEAREAAPRTNAIRNTVYKEYIALFDYSLHEDDILRAINLEIFTQLAVFSYDIQAYHEWIKTKKTEPLIPGHGPTAEELAALEAQRIQHELEEKRKLEEEAAKKAKKGGKETKKDVKDIKKEEEKKEQKKEEKKEEEDPEHKQQQEQQKQQEKKEQAFDLSYYNQQLGVLDEECVTEGICIEAMLDQIAYSISGASETFSATAKEVESIFSSIMHDIPGASSTDKQADKLKKFVGSDGKSPYQLLINESDDIQKNTYHQRLNNDDSVERREHLIFDEIAVPGINRKDMPPQATKSENLRQAEKSHINPFVSSDINDFERYLLLEEFENLMKTKDAKREWNFGDRTYEERYDKSALRQVLYKALLFEPDHLHSYYDNEDCLLVSCFYNKPPYRILRKKWNCNWRTLPNLENWMKFFKNSKSNLSNEFFYDMDYKIAENFHERVKLMYPNDDSVMICGKYCIGDKAYYHYKVVKENMIFGIENSLINGTKTAEVWVVLENQTRILVEMQKNEVKPPQLTETEERELEEKRRKAEEEAAAAAIEKARLEELAKKEAEDKKKGAKKGGKDTKKATKEDEMKASQLTEESKHQHTEPEKKEPEIPESYSATFTITLRNGLVVKFLSNGDIMQTLVKSCVKPVRKQFQDVVSDAAEKRDVEENNRIITGKGSVIKNMKDGSN